jgi:hypothetical protein
MDKRSFILASTALLLSCAGNDGPRGEGRVRVMLSAEDSITEGLALGPDVENSHDYPVRFDKFLATIGRVTLARTHQQLSATADGSFVVDMMQVGEEGVELFVLDDLAAGEWDKFSFETPAADEHSTRYEGVSPGDFHEMVEHGYTYWIEGQVERSAARGGPVHFEVKAAVPTRFHDCEYDGEPGVSVVADGTTTATVTLHGDHMFFNAFLTGSEANIERLAGYIVEADADTDGHVDNDELAALDATDAFRRELGYSLDGAPTSQDGTPVLIDTALDFVRAQLATQGHYQGEGECIPTLEDAGE